MSLTSRALFIIERNLGGTISLRWTAEQCATSPFHLAHAFGEATGFSLMDYVRNRRLTNAARELAAGAEDILSVALDHQYASHEAFSRAFKARFGKTPDQVRRARSTNGLALLEPIRYREGIAMKLKEPKIQTLGELNFVGLSRKVAYQDMQAIAGQWQQFMSVYYGVITNKIAEPPIGVTAAVSEDGLEYVCAAGVTEFREIPRGCIELTLSPATYAVFAHDGHITGIRETYNAIWNDWFPKSGRAPAEAPGIERHNASFDPRTGNGGVTIWLPIKT
jgi:AraC family transcriptional regulator